MPLCTSCNDSDCKCASNLPPSICGEINVSNIELFHLNWTPPTDRPLRNIWAYIESVTTDKTRFMVRERDYHESHLTTALLWEHLKEFKDLVNTYHLTKPEEGTAIDLFQNAINRQNISIVVTRKKPFNPVKEIYVGFSFLLVKSVSDTKPFPVPTTDSSEPWVKLFKIVNVLENSLDIFATLNVRCYLMDYFTGVIPEYRDKHLYHAMLKARKRICKYYGISVVVSLCLTSLSKEIASLGGYREMKNINYPMTPGYENKHNASLMVVKYDFSHYFNVPEMRSKKWTEISHPSINTAKLIKWPSLEDLLKPPTLVRRPVPKRKELFEQRKFLLPPPESSSKTPAPRQLPHLSKNIPQIDASSESDVEEPSSKTSPTQKSNTAEESITIQPRVVDDSFFFVSLDSDNTTITPESSESLGKEDKLKKLLHPMFLSSPSSPSTAEEVTDLPLSSTTEAPSGSTNYPISSSSSSDPRDFLEATTSFSSIGKGALSYQSGEKNKSSQILLTKKQWVTEEGHVIELPLSVRRKLSLQSNREDPSPILSVSDELNSSKAFLSREISTSCSTDLPEFLTLSSGRELSLQLSQFTLIYKSTGKYEEVQRLASCRSFAKESYINWTVFQIRKVQSLAEIVFIDPNSEIVIKTPKRNTDGESTAGDVSSAVISLPLSKRAMLEDFESSVVRSSSYQSAKTCVRPARYQLQPRSQSEKLGERLQKLPLRQKDLLLYNIVTDKFSTKSSTSDELQSKTSNSGDNLSSDSEFPRSSSSEDSDSPKKSTTSLDKSSPSSSSIEVLEVIETAELESTPTKLPRASTADTISTDSTTPEILSPSQVHYFTEILPVVSAKILETQDMAIIPLPEPKNSRMVDKSTSTRKKLLTKSTSTEKIALHSKSTMTDIQDQEEEDQESTKQYEHVEKLETVSKQDTFSSPTPPKPLHAAKKPVQYKNTPSARPVQPPPVKSTSPKVSQSADRSRAQSKSAFSFRNLKSPPPPPKMSSKRMSVERGPMPEVTPSTSTVRSSGTSSYSRHSDPSSLRKNPKSAGAKEGAAVQLEQRESLEEASTRPPPSSTGVRKKEQQ